MRLVTFSVQKFRNIIDSNEVVVQDDVTALVGKNESGKTTIIERIAGKLNEPVRVKFCNKFEISFSWSPIMKACLCLTF